MATATRALAAAVWTLLATGLVGLLGTMKTVWRHVTGQRGQFVTLHASSASATLSKKEKEGDVGGKPVTFLELVRDKVPALGPDARFHRPWWLPGGDLQTMYSSVADFSRVDPVVYERKLLHLPDEGILAVDITPPLSSRPASSAENVLLVAHGLTGGSHEAYVRAVLSRVTPDKQSGGQGFRAVVVNFRGCNGSPVVTPRLYHAGSSDDIRHVVLWICHTFPDCKLYGLGFSLGANILTKYVGEEGERCPLQGLITLANPWDFVQGSIFLPSTFLGHHVYRYVLGGALQALLRTHRRPFDEAPDLPLPRAVLEDVFGRRRMTLQEYDEVVTAALYGYKGALEYYADISSTRAIPGIRIPTLAINSIDDPVVGAASLPTRQVPRSPYLILAVTSSGGHLGWYERTREGRIRRWYVKPVEQFLAALVEYGLEDRPKPGVVLLGPEFGRQEGRDDVGFRVLSREQSETVVSGTEKSKLVSGW